MGVLSDIVGKIDTLTTASAAPIYQAALADITQVGAALGVLGLAIAGLQHVMGVAKYWQYFTWAVRYVFVMGNLLVWSNFNAIYTALDSGFNGYAAKIISVASASIQPPNVTVTRTVSCRPFDDACFNQYGGVGAQVKQGLKCGFTLFIACRSVKFQVTESVPGTQSPLAAAANGTTAVTTAAGVVDTLTDSVFGVARGMFKQIKFTKIGQSIKFIFWGTLMYVVGALYAAVAAMVIIYSKIGTLVALALAPIGCCLLIMPSTTSYFKSWLSFLLSSMASVLLVGALSAVVVLIAGSVIQSPENNDILAHVGLLISLGAATFMAMEIPSMASALTGGVGSSMGNMAASVAKSATSTAQGAAGVSSSGGGFAGAAGAKGATGVAGAAGIALTAGKMIGGAISSMARSSAARRSST